MNILLSKLSWLKPFSIYNEVKLVYDVLEDCYNQYKTFST